MTDRNTGLRPNIEEVISFFSAKGLDVSRLVKPHEIVATNSFFS